MTPPPSNRAEVTFNSALALPPSEREIYLAAECGEDNALQNEVRALLAAHEAAGDFLQTEIPSPPGVEAELARLKPEEEGECIGRYKLLQEIGEGGFGTVWMAEQIEPVTRRVALKIIKLGMDTKEVIARFESERQALAMMDHPNIAKVFDAGATQHGRPFFVMELVKGLPITHFCDERQLGTHERLALFGDVCAAINHAHQKGVIHRDIKPSNVMVTLHGDQPVVKVIDFGIAKATQGKLTDKTLFTRFEQFIGTPVYMSPEQASLSGLDIDTRSDIYALGILLYELLTGKPPFDAHTLASAGYEEMRRIIREVEPPKPSSRLSTIIGVERSTLARTRQIAPEKLSRLVEPDLDLIVMKAIEKDRSRRYDTADGLALDIQHFLADEPVSATPPSAGYKFRKFARRNKTALRVAAGTVSLLVAATVISSWQAVRSTIAEKLASDRLIQVEAEKKKAEQEKQIAQSVRDFLQKKLLAQTDTRTQADALLNVGESASGAKLNPTIRELLDRAARELTADKIESSFPKQPLVQAEILLTMGDTYREIGEHQAAIDFLKRAAALFRKQLGSDHPDTLASTNDLAVAWLAAGKSDQALQLFEETLELRKARLGPGHPDTLMSMNNLAEIYQATGEINKALPLLEETLRLQEVKLGSEDPLTLASMNNLADAYRSAGKMNLSLPLFEKTLELRKARLGPDHPDTLSSMSNLAEAYRAANKLDLALPLFEETLQFRKAKLGPDHPHTLQSMNNLAAGFLAAGKPDEALALFDETLQLRKARLGPDHPDTLASMNNLAEAYQTTGQLNKTLPLLDEVLRLQKAKLGPNHPSTLATMSNLAEACRIAGKMDLAISLNEEVLKLRTARLGPDHPDTLTSMNNLAYSYATDGRKDLALKLREEVLKLSRKVLGNGHPDTLLAMHNLALSYSNAGREDEAAKLREPVALHLAEAPTAVVVPAMVSLTPAAAKKDVQSLEENLAHVRKAKGPEHADTVAAMTELSAAYGADGNGRKAIKLGKETLALARRVLPVGDPHTVETMKVLVQLYKMVDLDDDARKLEAEMEALAKGQKGAPGR